MIADYARPQSQYVMLELGAAAAWRLGSTPRAKRRGLNESLVRAARANGDRATLVEIRRGGPPLVRRLKWKAERLWRRQTWLQRHERKRFLRNLRWGLDVRIWRRDVLSGKRSGLIWNMILSDRFGEDSLPQATRVWGKTAVATLIEGAKAFAESYESKSTGWSRANRLAAWGWNRIAIDDPDRLNALDAAGARNALAVMLTENNLPDWATALAQRNPALWEELLLPGIRTDLGHRDSGHPWYPGALSVASRQPSDLRRLFATEVMHLLRSARGPDERVIQYAGILVGEDTALHATLAALCSQRFYEHMFEGHPGFAAPWFAIWLARCPDAAWAAFRRLGELPRSDDGLRALLLALGEGPPVAGLAPEILGAMSLAYMRLVPIDEDDDSDGFVTARQEAERVRGALPTLIAGHTTQGARDVLEALAVSPEFAPYPGWLERLRDTQAMNAASPAAWPQRSVAVFLARFLKPPASASELRQLIERQLEAILADLIDSEFDRRGLFREALERDVRAFLGDALRLRAQNWYSVTQETVTASEKRMDLRIEGRPGHDEVVIIEIKIAGSSWKGDQLVDHIETQLVDQYLISKRVRHGIYLVIDLGQKPSWSMADGNDLSFDELVSRMTAKASTLLAMRDHLEGLTVLGRRIEVPARPKAPSRRSLGV